MSFLWNGKKFDLFLQKRGLKEGDPLSSYLFVLCMEKLRYIVKEAFEEGS